MAFEINSRHRLDCHPVADITHFSQGSVKRSWVMGLDTDGALLPTDNGDYGETFGPWALIFLYSLPHRVMAKTVFFFYVYCTEKGKCGWNSKVIQS